MLTRRQLDLLMYLINSREALFGKTLAEVFHVNVRTIRTDVKKINEFLTAYDIQIKTSNQFGYVLEKNDITKFYEKNMISIIKSEEGFHVPQTPNERISYLFFLLSDGQGYTIEDLSDIFYISEVSLYQDLNVVRRFIEKRFKGIKLQNDNGKYRLIGPESAIRNILSGIVTQRYHHLLEQKYSEYIDEDGEFLDVMYIIIENLTIYKEKFAFILTGESLYSFASDIALCVVREKQGYLLTYPIIEKTEIFSDIQQFLISLHPDIMKLNEENWCYLEKRFYLKNFLKEITNKTDYYFIIEDYKKKMKSQYQMEVLLDDKSCEYALTFINFFIGNEKEKYYWNMEDKNEIMIADPMCYLLAIEFSRVIYQHTGYYMNHVYLSKFSLILQESFLRNKVKSKAVLISNCDKEHISCLLHKIINELGNKMDIIGNGTLYDAVYGNIDLDSYDIIISTEAMPELDHNDYIKISSIGSQKDMQKIAQYMNRNSLKEQRTFDLKIIHIDEKYNDIKQLIKALLLKYSIQTKISLDEVMMFELDHIFWIKREGERIYMICPFFNSIETTLFQVILKYPLTYKKKEINNIKILIIDPLDMKKINEWID